jgi:hypothetical protein
MKDSFKKSGYDLEEVYFQKLNQELIEKLKEEKKKKQHLTLVVNNAAPETPETSQEILQSKSNKKAA